MLKRLDPSSDSLSTVFHHRGMQILVYTLLNDPHHFLDALKHEDLSVMEGGNAEMKKRMLQPNFKDAANPGILQTTTFLRAYPHAAQKLFLWAQELSNGVSDKAASIQPDDQIMEFFASVGFLNERATGPADSVFSILGLEVPERQNRGRSERRQNLTQMQRAFP